MPQLFDVAVVGSGPAGASCALRLARLGYAVALIDAQVFPRAKLCGEYLSAGSVRELEELGVNEALQLRRVNLETIRFSSHGQVAEIALPPGTCSIPRILLDDCIRSEAIRCGVTPITGRVASISRSDDDVSVEAIYGDEKRIVNARCAVGADGMRSTVARLLNLSLKPFTSTFALGAHFKPSPLESSLELYVGAEGYFALNPGPAQSVNAVFVFDERHLRQHGMHLQRELNRFSDAITHGRRALTGMESRERRKAIGPLDHRTRALTCGNVILVGDAAGFADPFTGQGIFLALAGARLAASAICDVFTGRRSREDAWRSYARDLGALISRRKRLSSLVHSLVAHPALAVSANAVWRRAPVVFAPLIRAVSGG